jgi:hypothetical protein
MVAGGLMANVLRAAKLVVYPELEALAAQPAADDRGGRVSKKNGVMKPLRR